MPIIHSGYVGYVLPTGNIQRYGAFPAQGDPAYFPTWDALGQYVTRTALAEGDRVTFDVEQDARGNLEAVNVVPE